MYTALEKEDTVPRDTERRGIEKDEITSEEMRWDVKLRNTIILFSAASSADNNDDDNDFFPNYV